MAISKFSSRTCHQLYMHQHSPKLDSQACCSSFSGGMAVRYKEFCCQAWKFCGDVQYGDATKNSFCLEFIMFSFSERVDAQEHQRSLLRWASSIVCRLISASAVDLPAQVQVSPILSTYNASFLSRLQVSTCYIGAHHD